MTKRSFSLNQEEFTELAERLAQNLKSEKDVSAMTRMLAMVVMERALEIDRFGGILRSRMG